MAKIVLPLEFVSVDQNSYHIFMPCIINKTECDMLVDTGASRSVFDISFISDYESDLVFDEIVTMGISPGNVDAKPGRIDVFSVGGRVWLNVNAMFMDLGHINEMYSKMVGKRIAGLIGGDFLMSTKACLDYGKARVTFSIPSRYSLQF